MMTPSADCPRLPAQRQNYVARWFATGPQGSRNADPDVCLRVAQNLRAGFYDGDSCDGDSDDLYLRRGL